MLKVKAKRYGVKITGSQEELRTLADILDADLNWRKVHEATNGVVSVLFLDDLYTTLDNHPGDE